MNSVHEPGSRTMSQNWLRNSTKSNRDKNRPSAPSAQPWLARAPRPPSQPCPACAHACCRSPVAPEPACHASAPRACLPRARAACLQRARLPRATVVRLPSVRLPRAPRSPQRPAYACLRTPCAQRLSLAPCCDTVACLATQAALSPATILQVVLRRYNLASCSPSSHNTVQCIAIHCSLLPAFFIAIHYTMLQYTFQPK